MRITISSVPGTTEHDLHPHLVPKLRLGMQSPKLRFESDEAPH